MRKTNMLVIVLGFLAVIIASGVAVSIVNNYLEDQNSVVGSSKREVVLYYYDPGQDKDETGNILCSRKGLVGVNREIDISQTPIQDSIRLLLKGEITQEEKTRGITTEYPLSGVELKGADLKNGALTLELNDPQNRTSGGSCRAGILWFQIEATAKQFSQVQEVRFIPEELFQP